MSRRRGLRIPRPSRRTLIGIGAVVLVAAVGSAAIGSRPEATDTDAPVPPCPDSPNCARLRVSIGAPPNAVVRAVHQAFGGVGDEVAAPSAFVASATGALAAFDVGSFTDDVAVEVEPDSNGSVLWVRSASREGWSDLGVNRRRARRIVEAVTAWLPEGVVED